MHLTSQCFHTYCFNLSFVSATVSGISPILTTLSTALSHNIPVVKPTFPLSLKSPSNQDIHYHRIYHRTVTPRLISPNGSDAFPPISPKARLGFVVVVVVVVVVVGRLGFPSRRWLCIVFSWR